MSEWFDESGVLLKQIPEEAVEDCSHQGECHDDCQFWVQKLNFEVPRDLAVEYLKSTGGWELEELQEMDNEELAIRILWIACGNIQEAFHSGEEDAEWAWIGLIP
jgi:hypothetical protein